MTVVSFVYTKCQALGAAHCFGFNMRGVWPFGRVRKVSLLIRDTSALDHQNFLPLFRQVSTTVLIRMIRQTSCMSCERTSLKFALWPELVASFQPVLSSLFDYFVPVSCCPTITFEFQSFSNVSMHALCSFPGIACSSMPSEGLLCTRIASPQAF